MFIRRLVVPLASAHVAVFVAVTTSSIAAAAAAAAAQTLELVSVADDGSPANGDCASPSTSDDGSRVAFASIADNLVAGDGNGRWDVFVRDRAAGTTRRVSLASDGTEGDGDSFQPRITANGRFVFFASLAENLVDSDLNLHSDIFVHEIDSGTTVRINVNASGQPANGDSGDPAPSADGRFVFFDSDADNLVANDGNYRRDVFACDLSTGAITRVSVASDGSEAYDYRGYGSWLPACSRDGRYVTFGTWALNLDPRDADSIMDVYLRDLVAGTTTLVSVDSGGVKANWHTWFVASPVSDDGRLVAFESWADNLVGGDSNLVADVFVRDVVAGTTTAAGVDSDGKFPSDYPGGSEHPSMSSDGRFITFEAVSDFFDPTETSSQIGDVYCRDATTPLTTRQSIPLAGGEGDYHSRHGAIGADGRFIVFTSEASNLLGGPPIYFGAEVYLRERRLDAAGWQNYGAGFPGTHGIPSLVMSADPVLHHDTALQFTNSSGLWSVALLLLGDTSVQWPTGWGGDLLVDPSTTLFLSLPPNGQRLADRVPSDESLVGLVLYAQVLEIDPGASEGISFTPGVEFTFGF